MPSPERNDGIRLQKVLATAGLGSRRACEVLVEEGRVEVDGRKVTGQGMRVDPDKAVIKVDGLRVNVVTNRIYLALNKPRGVLSAMSDDSGRPTLADYVTRYETRLFHVGRLDADTEGLILIMNDGELSHRLSHPSYEVRKTYLAEVPGPIPRDLGKRLRAGIELEDGLVRVDGFRIVGQTGERVLTELILHEGRNHVVRRLMEEVGHPVRGLVRTRIGPVALGDLRSGRTRDLSRVELGQLYELVGL